MNNMERYKQSEHERIDAMDEKATVVDMLLNAYDSVCNYCPFSKRCSKVNPSKNLMVCKEYILENLYNEVEDNEFKQSD